MRDQLEGREQLRPHAALPPQRAERAPHLARPGQALPRRQPARRRTPPPPSSATRPIAVARSTARLGRKMRARRPGSALAAAGLAGASVGGRSRARVLLWTSRSARRCPARSRRAGSWPVPPSVAFGVERLGRAVGEHLDALGGEVGGRLLLQPLLDRERPLLADSRWFLSTEPWSSVWPWISTMVPLATTRSLNSALRSAERVGLELGAAGRELDVPRPAADDLLDPLAGELGQVGLGDAAATPRRPPPAP